MTNENAAIPKRDSKKENPGFIRTPMSITLNTREASMIFHGRKADPATNTHPIPGLPAYTTMINKFWGDFLNGNLYACWWCMKLEQNIVKAEAHLQVIKKQLNDKVPDYFAQVDLGKSESVKPISVPASFSSSYSYKVLYLLIEMDQLMTKLLGMRHTAILNPADSQKMKSDLTNTVKQVLSGIRGYRENKVTAADVETKNAIAIAAAEEMGELPLKEVLAFKPQIIMMPKVDWSIGQKTDKPPEK